MCHANKEKQEMTYDRRKNQNARRKGNLLILGNIGSRHHQTSGDKRKKYLRKMRKIFKTKLYSRNLIKGINPWAVLLIRYLGLLKWMWEELKQIDQRTRKLMTMHKALCPKDDVNRLYV